MSEQSKSLLGVYVKTVVENDLYNIYRITEATINSIYHYFKRKKLQTTSKEMIKSLQEYKIPGITTNEKKLLIDLLSGKEMRKVSRPLIPQELVSLKLMIERRSKNHSEKSMLLKLLEEKIKKRKGKKVMYWNFKAL